MSIARTPLGLTTLLHIFSVAEPLPEAPAVKNAVAAFISLGLIRGNSNKACGYETTELGQAHVHQLCNLPYPKKRTVFVGMDGKDIVP